MSNNVIEEIGQHKPEHPRVQNKRYMDSENRKTPSGANIIARSDIYDKYPLPKITGNRRNGGRKYNMNKSTRTRSYKKNKTRRTKRMRSKKI